MAKRKTIIRNLLEWGIFIIILGFFILSGLYKPIVTGIQQLIILTGLSKPELVSKENRKIFDYNMEVFDKDGHAVHLQVFKKKVLFINFWATWCPPCLAEMPDIHSLYSQISSENIVFLMISRDDDFKKALDFVAERKYNFPIYFVKRISSQFSVESIPTTYVISPEGEIVVEKKGFASYDTPEFKEFILSLVE